MLRFNASTTTTFALILLSGFTLLAVPSCADPNDPNDASEAPRAGELPVSTLVLDIDIPADTDKATIEAIAQTVESVAGPDVAGVRIKVEQGEGETMVLAIELWGAELAAGDEIINKLRADHPSLSDASITSSTHEGPPNDEPVAGEHDDETLEQTRARVTDELRAKGVEGEIDVQVIDDEQGRRIEVHVEAGE
jgi:hypothetical protein